MTRKTIRVEMPVNTPEEFVRLAENIRLQHQNLGENSPLMVLNVMDVFNDKITQGKQLRDRSKEMKRVSESLMEESMLNLGLATGQTSQTPGTVYNLMLKVRDFLLVTHRGNEEKLSEWGFKVVVGQAKAPRKKA